MIIDQMDYKLSISIAAHSISRGTSRHVEIDKRKMARCTSIVVDFAVADKRNHPAALETCVGEIKSIFE